MIPWAANPSTTNHGLVLNPATDTQANAASSEETASASEELTTQSMELRTGVDVLVKLVNGQSYGEAHPKQVAKNQPSRKADAPPVKKFDLKSRRNGSVPTPAANGNGHRNGDDHDESFFDM